MKIICPNCQHELIKNERTYHCCNNHCFDLASSGYLNLLIKNKKNNGDNKLMVDARKNFLIKDYYLNLKLALIELIKQYNPHSMLDLACGEGYYTKDFPVSNLIGIDLSKDAINYAAKKDKEHQYIISSIFSLPIATESIDLITTVFAPYADEEIYRVLNNNGIFIMVSPGKKHLWELKEKIYTTPLENKPLILNTSLKLVKKINLVNQIHLQNNQDLKNLFMMTPYYYKTKESDQNKINYLQDLIITTDFEISIYQKVI